MLLNRSIPRCTVIPEIGYPDIGAAIDWLTNAFGLTLRLRIGDHRAQMNVGDGAVVLTERADAASVCSVLIRVKHVDRHHDRARQHGATIIRPPADHSYGERQYTAADHAGHRWTFSQSIADVSIRQSGAARRGNSSDGRALSRQLSDSPRRSAGARVPGRVVDVGPVPSSAASLR